MKLPVPNDPFTNKPFEYQMSKSTATLKMAKIPGIERQRNYVYRISAPKK